MLSPQERKAAENIKSAIENNENFKKNRNASNDDLNKTMLQEIDKHFMMPRDDDKTKTEVLKNREATQKFYDYMIYDIGSYYLLKSKDLPPQEDKAILDLVSYFLKLKNPDLYNNPQGAFAKDFASRPYRALEQYFKKEYSGTKLYQEKIGPEVQTGLTTPQKDALIADNDALEKK